MSDVLDLAMEVESESTKGSAPATKNDPREQAVRDRYKISQGSDTLKLAAEVEADMEVEARRQQRAYAEKSSLTDPDTYIATTKMLLTTGGRDQQLEVLRKLTPEQREAALKLAPGIAQQLGDERGGSVMRTIDAVSRGATRLPMALKEVTGFGGTREEIDYLHKLNSASQEFAPARPDDPWYSQGALQAAEMAPDMVMAAQGGVLGGMIGKAGGTALGRAAAAGVPGAKTVSQAAGAIGKAPTAIGLKAVSAEGVGSAAGVLAPMWAPQYVQEVDALKELGMKDGLALRTLAGATAAAVGLLESIVPNPLKGGNVSLKQGAIKAVRQHLWNTAKNLPGEITEEGLQGVASGVGEYVAQYFDKDAKKKTIGEAFSKGWQQASDSVLPLVFMLGAPGVAGAASVAIRARREQLEQLRSKGFVSKDDAKKAGIEVGTRKEIAANVDAEIEDLKSRELIASVNESGAAAESPQEDVTAPPPLPPQPQGEVPPPVPPQQQGNVVPPPLPSQQQGEVPPPLPPQQQGSVPAIPVAEEAPAPVGEPPAAGGGTIGSTDTATPSPASSPQQQVDQPEPQSANFDAYTDAAWKATGNEGPVSENYKASQKQFVGRVADYGIQQGRVIAFDKKDGSSELQFAAIADELDQRGYEAGPVKKSRSNGIDNIEFSVTKKATVATPPDTTSVGMKSPDQQPVSSPVAEKDVAAPQAGVTPPSKFASWTVQQGSDGKLYRVDPKAKTKYEKAKTRQPVDPAEVVVATQDQFGNPIDRKLVGVRQEFAKNAKPGAEFTWSSYPTAKFKVQSNGDILDVTTGRRMGTVQSTSNNAALKANSIKWTSLPAPAAQPATAAPQATEQPAVIAAPVAKQPQAPPQPQAQEVQSRGEKTATDISKALDGLGKGAVDGLYTKVWNDAQSGQLQKMDKPPLFEQLVLRGYEKGVVRSLEDVRSITEGMTGDFEADKVVGINNLNKLASKYQGQQPVAEQAQVQSQSKSQDQAVSVPTAKPAPQAPSQQVAPVVPSQEVSSAVEEPSTAKPKAEPSKVEAEEQKKPLSQPVADETGTKKPKSSAKQMTPRSYLESKTDRQLKTLAKDLGLKADSREGVIESLLQNPDVVDSLNSALQKAKPSKPRKKKLAPAKDAAKGKEPIPVKMRSSDGTTRELLPSELTAAEKKQKNILEKMGVTLRLIEGGNFQTPGVFNPKSMTVWLDRSYMEYWDSLWEEQSRPSESMTWGLFLHEMFHAIKKIDPEAWNGLRDWISANPNEKELLDKATNDYVRDSINALKGRLSEDAKKSGKKANIKGTLSTTDHVRLVIKAAEDAGIEISDGTMFAADYTIKVLSNEDVRNEEGLSRYLEDKAGDFKFWDDLGNENPGLLTKIGRWLLKALRLADSNTLAGQTRAAIEKAIKRNNLATGEDLGIRAAVGKGDFSVGDINVDEVRAKDRKGNRVSKGLAVKSVKGTKVYEETDDLSFDYVKKNAPDVFIKNANTIADYPLVRGKRVFEKARTVEQAQEIYDVFVREVADNLNYLYSEYDSEFRMPSTLWYDGANAIANRLADDYKVSPEQVAGIIAAMSPQKDWYQNVRLAELLLEAFRVNPVMTPEMIAHQRDVVRVDGLKEYSRKVRLAESALAKANLEYKGTTLENYRKIESVLSSGEFLQEGGKTSSELQKLASQAGVGFAKATGQLKSKMSPDEKASLQKIANWAITIFKEGAAASPGKSLSDSDLKKLVSEHRREVKSAIDDSAASLVTAKAKLAKSTTKADAVVSKLESHLGKTLDSVPEEIQSFMVRLHHEVNTTKDYNVIAPDGRAVGVAKNDNGENARLAWGSYGEIGKGVSIRNNGSPRNITRRLGQQHKIRNFYNNIIDPMSEDGDVTMDTHAIAAALLMPLSGKSTQVTQNFGGSGAKNAGAFGIKGLYYAFAEAYNVSAKENGLLPRQMQSATWDPVRGLFTDVFKSVKKNVTKVNDIWESYADGKISVEEAREQVFEAAGGIDTPTWARPAREDVGGSVRKKRDRGRVRGDGQASVGTTDGGGDGGQRYSPGRRPEPTGYGGRRYSSGRYSPLEGAPSREGATGPDPRLVDVAEQYARENGINLKRQAEYVKVDEDRAKRIAKAYEGMPHAPSDPAVKEAYDDLIRQTKAQYDALVKAGYVFTFYDGTSDPYDGNPVAAMRDMRQNKTMAVYGTYDGYGTEGITKGAVDDNPMLADTGLQWKDQGGTLRPVTANDLFRAVHDAFGHGLEGATFRARGEENAWQAHVRLFTGPAIGAITSETRGQNSWLNYGPYGEQNKTAKVLDTVFADQKTGLMPEWTWTEGRAADMEEAGDEGVRYSPSRQTETPEFKKWFGDSKVVDEQGKPLVVYHGTNPRSAEKVGSAGFSKRNEGFVAGFFDADPVRAEGYAVSFDQNWREVKDGVIVPVFISIKNPKVYRTEYQFPLTKEGIERLKQNGHDGLAAGNVFVPFEPSQIKSATGNRGTFDAANPDIRYSPVRQAKRKRDPEVTKAAQDLKAGLIDRDQYQRIVDVRMPLRKFDEVPPPASREDMIRGLANYKAGTRLKRDLIQDPEAIAAGTVLESRLDIPAYENEDVWVVTLHQPRSNIKKGTAAKVVAFTPTAVLKNVTFGVTEEAALNIAAGKPKATIATMRGEYVPMTAKQAYKLAETNKDRWVEIGMNPIRHTYFYDKDTQTPVVSAEEVVQVGGMVLAKNPAPGQREDYRYSPGRKKKDDILAALYKQLEEKGAIKPQAAGARTTSIKNRKTDELRAESGLPPRVRPAKESFEMWEEEARRRYPTAKDRLELVAEVEKDPERLGKIESAAIGQHIAYLDNQRRAGKDIFDELRRTIKAANIGGTEAGRALVSRKAERFSDYSLAGLVNEHFSVVGRDPTDAQMQEYSELANRIEKLEKDKVDLAKKLAKETIARKKAEAELPPKQKPPQEKIGTKRATLLKKVADGFAAFQNAWGGGGSSRAAVGRQDPMGSIYGFGFGAEDLPNPSSVSRDEWLRAYMPLMMKGLPDSNISDKDMEVLGSAFGDENPFSPGSKLMKMLDTWATQGGLQEINWGEGVRVLFEDRSKSTSMMLEQIAKESGVDFNRDAFGDPADYKSLAKAFAKYLPKYVASNPDMGSDVKNLLETSKALLDPLEYAINVWEDSQQASTSDRAAAGRQIETSAFKKWFGDSKVVGDDGGPLVVYHGSPNANINNFKTWGWGESNAAFFSSDPDEAKHSRGKQNAVYPVYLSLKNPLMLNAQDKKSVLGEASQENELIDQSAADGYDGIIWKDAPNNTTTYAVFEPTQIKSATGNRGTFDSNNPDIRYSPGRQEPDIKSAAASLVATLREAGVSSMLELESQVSTNMPNVTPAQMQVIKDAWEDSNKKDKVTSPIGANPQRADIAARAKELMRSAIELGYGAEKENWMDVVDVVHDQLSLEVPGIDKYDTMQAISDYGVWRELPPEQVEVIIRAVRGKARQSLKIEDALKAISQSNAWLKSGVSPEEVATRLRDQGLLPKATGQERATPDSIERDLIAEFNKLKKTLPVPAESREGQLKSALTTAKTAASNRLEMLDKDIASLQEAVDNKTELAKPVAEKSRLEPDAELASLRSQLEEKRRQRDELKAQYEKIFPDTSPKKGRKQLTDEQKLEASVKLLRRQIDAVKADVQSLIDGTWVAAGKSAELTSERKEELKAELASLRASQKQARQASPTYQAREEAKYWERYRKSQEKRLAFWMKRRDEAQAGRLPVPLQKRTITEKAIIQKNMEIEEAQYEAMIAIEKANRDTWNAGQWIGQGILEATSLIPKTLMLGMEMSFVLRQGFFYTYSQPMKAFAALVEAMPAVFSQRLALASMENIESRANAQEYHLAGVDFTSATGPKAKLEEMYQSSIMQWLERTETKLLLPLRTWAKVYAMFERGNRTFSNIMKADMYDIQKRDTLAAREFFGTNTDWTDNDIKQVGRTVNIFSGRGTGLRGGNPWLDWLFLARRWTWSRIQADFIVPFQLATPQWIGQWNADRGMRVALAKLYIQAMVGHTAKMAAAYFAYSVLAGDDEEEKPTMEFDLRSSDALALKIGETRFKDEGGLMPAVVLAARLLTGEIKTGKGEIKSIYGADVDYGGKTAADFVINYGRYKLGTAPSAILEWISGRDAVGNVMTKTDIVKSRISPLTWREIYAAESELGLKRGTLAALEAFFGVSVSTHGDETKYKKANETDRLKQFETDLKRMEWDSPDPPYKDLLTADQVAKVKSQRDHKKQSVVYEAFVNPVRKNYKSDDSYKEAVETRDKFLGEFKQTGLSYEESRKLLIDYWKRNYGSPYETKNGVSTLKEGITNRLRQLRKTLSGN